MAGQFANYLETRVLSKAFGATDFTPPATYYVALFSVMPAADGTGGTECSGNGYARKSVTNNTTSFPAASVVSSKGQTQNGTDIIFAAASGQWASGSNIVGCGLYDAATNGNLVAYASFTTPKPDMTNLDVFEIPANDLTITLQ